MSVFDKWTKKATGQAVNTAIITAKETLNDKLDTYSGIIKIGLTLGVIVFGSKKINAHFYSKNQPSPPVQTYPAPAPQPIVINNYFDRGYNNGRPYETYQQHQNRRQHGDLRRNGQHH